MYLAVAALLYIVGSSFIFNYEPETKLRYKILGAIFWPVLLIIALSMNLGRPFGGDDE